jgi:hypothetical protein
MNTTKYKRVCPKCGRDIYHTTQSNLNLMVKKNSVCRDCFHKARRKYNTDSFTRICECGETLTFATRYSYTQSCSRGKFICRSCASHRGPRSEETKKKISNTKMGHVQTPETRTKMSLIARKRTAKKIACWGLSPNVNPDGCMFIEEYGKTHGYHFEHGLNGGEAFFPSVGVWTDGYDKEKNVVFEYDEPKHFDVYGNLRRKDVNRMNDLKKHLGCKVIRYDELRQTIKEY